MTFLDISFKETITLFIDTEIISMQKRLTNKEIFVAGIWKDNPVLRQVLGICSTLAVTNLLINTLVMSAGLLFTTVMSSMTVSMLRNLIPARIRMMVQTLIIASYVIMVDIVIQSYLPDISEALGPYVGLIITNCIIMGRCEAFAQNNRVVPSMIDGFAMGIGYAIVLAIIAIIRETLGFGTLLGYRIMPEFFTPWTIMIVAPGAFFVLGVFIWVVRAFSHENSEIKAG
jgi:Na+-transporting NADH:ubiquinone oxidoreductase subunit D